MNPIVAALQNLQTLWVIGLIALVIAVIVFFIVRRGSRPSAEDLESIKVVSGGEEVETAVKKREKLSEEELTKLEARVLNALRAKGTLRPHLIPASKEGGHYPELAGVSERDVRTVIRGLIERGLVLEGEREFSAISCPICGSCSQVAFISCKNCGSFRIEEVKYYKHACGFVGPESSFRTESGLVCPHCGSSENIEVYSKKYRCPDCGSEFEEPNVAFKCGSCGALYDEQTMEVKTFKRLESSREMLTEYERVSRAVRSRLSGEADT